MNDIDRFQANVPYPMWPELYAVFTALDAGNTALAQQRWNESTPTPSGTYCQRSAGAIEKGYKDHKTGVPVKLYDKGKISSTPIDFTYEPGVITAFESAATGGGSASAGEGSEGLYGGVFDTLPATANPLDPAQFPAWGRSAIMGLPISPSQFLLLYQVKQAELSGRVDVR